MVCGLADERVGASFVLERFLCEFAEGLPG